VGDANSRGQQSNCISGNYFGRRPRPESQRHAAHWRLYNSSSSSHNSFSTLKRKQKHTTSISAALLHTNEALKNFSASASSIERQFYPTAEELRKAATFDQSSKSVSKKSTIRDHFFIASELSKARTDCNNLASHIAQQLRSGGFGSIPTVKDDSSCRLLFENINSLAIWENFDRIYEMNGLYRKYDADCALALEIQVQHDLARRQMKEFRLERLLWPGQDKRVITSHNIHERIQRSQPGGTMIALFSRLSQFVQSSGVNPHGLGRYCWIQVGSGSVSTIIVVLYVPCTTSVTEDSADFRWQTVYNQQGRYFRALGDNRCPWTILADHIGSHISQWKAEGHQVLLLTDANSDVYRGIVAKHLAEDDVCMTEKCKEVVGRESPNSHVRGQNPISGVFATSEIVVQHVFQSAHGGGVGGHH
jgi:hypothetical protein